MIVLWIYFNSGAILDYILNKIYLQTLTVLRILIKNFHEYQVFIPEFRSPNQSWWCYPSSEIQDMLDIQWL